MTAASPASQQCQSPQRPHCVRWSVRCVNCRPSPVLPHSRRGLDSSGKQANNAGAEASCTGPPQAKCPLAASQPAAFPTTTAGMPPQSERDGRTAGRARAVLAGVQQALCGWVAAFRRPTSRRPGHCRPASLTTVRFQRRRSPSRAPV